MPGHEKLPRLCFVGPILGHNPGWVLSQGEILAELLASEGYPVRLTSTITNRVLRLGDIVRSLLIWRQEIDIVILMVFSGPAFGIVDIASWVTKLIRKPLVLWLHGGDLPRFSERYPSWVQRIFRRGDALVAPSGYLVHQLDRLSHRVETIPNVLEIDNYLFRHRKQVQPRLLWMRTFEDIYYPEMAVEVLAQLRSVFPEAQLTMAGQDTGMLETVERFVEHERLGDHVRFPGFLSLEDKQREFAAHDIFLNTNRVDNMPVSVVEAAAFGLPVVATAVGGIPYLLKNEKTALLVADEDVQGMTEAVTRLVAKPELAGHLSANGRRLAESCAWHQVKNRWERLFDKIT